MKTRYKRPDTKNAQSIIEASQRDLQFTLTLMLTAASAPTIIRNIYESFRMLGDALLVKKGIVSQDHIAPIKELLKLSVNTSRPILLIDNLRILRHNIQYYGYVPKLVEAEDVLSLAKNCYAPLFAEVSKQIKH